ncbi:MAG TPA: hypothetical protein ENI87_01135 [bacterium]|nr:hypothetical protein [bacterium]
MNETERHARDTLKGQGFRVTSVPRTDTKTADFLVEDDRSTYLVEVTGKEESEFLRNLLSEARRRGRSYGSRGISPSNTLDGVVRKKARQLAETSVRADFQVLWIGAFHGDAGYLANLLLRTLYGVAEVYAIRSPREQPSLHECLYYHRFSFFRATNLDAVVFSTKNHGMLCVNALSERADRFRETKLYGLFESPVDPARAPDGVLVVAPEVDRTRPNGQWQHLKDHYGLMTSVVAECECRGVRVRRRDSSA